MMVTSNEQPPDLVDQPTRKRILLVDDEAAIRRLIVATLGNVDFDLSVADCGRDAINLAREVRPDLVLLDVTMPDMDGFDVAEHLRSETPTRTTPIIMLTARNTAEDLARGVAVRANEYLVKPFSPLRLLNAVYQLLGGEFTPSVSAR